MNLNVLNKVGDITSAAFNKVGDTLQDTSKGLASSFEDAFEIRGEKTEAQLEMERWQAEQAASQTAAEINASLSGAATHSPGKTGVPAAASSASERDHGVIGSDPASLAAVGKVASALKEVRSQAEGISGDDQASVFDKVIHQQRMQLAKLNKELSTLRNFPHPGKHSAHAAELSTPCCGIVHACCGIVRTLRNFPHPAGSIPHMQFSTPCCGILHLRNCPHMLRNCPHPTPLQKKLLFRSMKCASTSSQHASSPLALSRSLLTSPRRAGAASVGGGEEADGGGDEVAQAG